MRHFLKQSRYAVAALTALAVFTCSTEALAQTGQPGESKTYNHEEIQATVPDGTSINDHLPPVQNLETNDSYVEARNGSGNEETLIRVWRSRTANSNGDFPVWYSVNPSSDGPRSDIGTTATSFAPAVVPFQSNRYMIFHVGTDNHIYYVIYDPLSHVNGETWTAIPGATTDNPVSAVQFNSSGAICLVYRGLTNQNVYGTFFNPNTLSWGNSQGINGGEALSGPSITYNPVSEQLAIAVRGTDQSIWTTRQTVGSSNWSSWLSLGQTTTTSPQIVSSQDGFYTISYVSPGQAPFYRRFNLFMLPTNPDPLEPNNGWTQDLSGFLTFCAVMLVANGNNIYSLLTGLDRNGYWKPL